MSTSRTKRSQLLPLTLLWASSSFTASIGGAGRDWVCHFSLVQKGALIMKQTMGSRSFLVAPPEVVLGVVHWPLHVCTQCHDNDLWGLLSRWQGKWWQQRCDMPKNDMIISLQGWCKSIRYSSSSSTCCYSHDHIRGWYCPTRRLQEYLPRCDPRVPPNSTSDAGLFGCYPYTSILYGYFVLYRTHPLSVVLDRIIPERTPVNCYYRLLAA